MPREAKPTITLPEAMLIIQAARSTRSEDYFINRSFDMEVAQKRLISTLANTIVTTK
jgi:hypothetical protein